MLMEILQHKSKSIYISRNSGNYVMGCHCKRQ